MNQPTYHRHQNHRPGFGSLSVLAEQIKDRVDVVMAAAGLGYDYSGPVHANYPCPGCDEVSASKRTLHLYDDGERWWCFHCNTGGDVIDWLAMRLNVKKKDAINGMAARLGLSLNAADIFAYMEKDLEPSQKRTLAAEAGADLTARKVLSVFAAWRKGKTLSPDWVAAWERVLSCARSREPHVRATAIPRANKLASLSIPPNAVHSAPYLAAGYAADQFRETLLSGVAPYTQYAQSRGWLQEEADCYRVGCCARTTRWEDRIMVGRVVFPVADFSGRVCGFTGRLVDPALTPKPDAKYVNSFDNPIFHKGDLLFGADKAIPAILSCGYAVVVEGAGDAVACRRDSVDPVVAPMGGAMTFSHAERLSLVTKKAVLMNDGDEAGQAANDRASAALSAVGVTVVRARVPEGEDPDSYQRRRPGGLRLLVQEALVPRRDTRLDLAERELLSM